MTTYTVKFHRAVGFTLEAEGLLSDRPQHADPGGVTKYGISLRFAKAIGLDLTGDGITTDDDVRALTREKAVELYHKYFWTAVEAEKLPWWAAMLMFDAAVHHGPARAKKFAVRATGRGDYYQAMRQFADDEHMFGRIRERVGLFLYYRLNFMMSLANWPHNDKGWVKRLFKLAHAMGTYGT